MTRIDWRSQWLSTGRVLIPFIGPSGRAPFPTGEWDLWVPSFSWQSLQGRTPTCWVELHQPCWYTQPKTWRQDYERWLTTHVDRPVIMWRTDPMIPRSVEYPLAYVRTAHPAPLAMRGTVDWLIALAICLDAQEIALWGVDYDSLHEKLYQQSGAAYWVGYARGCGIDVTMSPGCTLFDTPMPRDLHYGPDYPPWPEGHHPDVYPTQSPGAFKDGLDVLP